MKFSFRTRNENFSQDGIKYIKIPATRELKEFLRT